MTLTKTRPTIETIDLDLIDPNPWQPRAAIAEAEISDLAASIDEVGLLQEPLLRQLGDRFQAAFGHRRIEAVRLLAAGGRWTGGIPARVEDLDDAVMAYMALAENNQRRGISAAETTRAWKRALDEIDGVTMTDLAERVGVARSTMSKQLLILRLPDSVLDLVHDGTLSVRGARELLALVADDHRHDDMIDAVLADCGHESEYSLGGARDFRIQTIRASIRGLTGGRPLRAYSYKGLDHPERLWRALEEGQYTQAPTFDVEEFKAAYPTCLHLLPKGERSGGMLWTCSVKEWRQWQTRATREKNKAAAAGAAPAPPKPQKRKTPADKAYEGWRKAIRADPVVIGVIGKTRAMRLKDVLQDLTDEERKQLGTRIRPVRIGYNLPDGARYLPAVAHPAEVRPDPRVTRAEYPPMFDFNPCHTCVEGAAWTQGETDWSTSVDFVCTNSQAWSDKKSQGMSLFLSRLEEDVPAENEADSDAVGGFMDRIDDEWGKLLVSINIAWIMHCHAVKPWEPERDRYKHDYYPATAIRFAELIGAELPSTQHTWAEMREWEVHVTEHFRNAPKGFDWTLAGALVVMWRARVGFGFGGPMPDVARATSGRETTVAAG